MVQTATIQDTKFSFYGGSSADSLTAISPATQATALALTAQVNRVTSAVAGAAVALPQGVGAAGAWNLKGCPVTIINATANDILVYPANGSGDTINGGASTAPVTLPSNSVASFEGATGYSMSKTANWYMNLSASAGGGPIDGALQIVVAAGSNSQAVAVAVTAGNVIVATVSATTRAIRLSAPGTNKSWIVFNDTATAVKVYPATNGTISASSTNVAVQIAAHKGEIFVARSGTHYVVMGAGGV